MQTITQRAIQAAKTAMMAVSDTENTVNAARLVPIMARTSSPVLTLLTFNWKREDKNNKTLKQRQRTFS